MKRSKMSTRDPMRTFMTYFILPVWVGAGLLDYIWHRRTRIETTSGLAESLTHSLMMIEAAPAVLGGLFLEINAGVIAAMIASSVAHEATAIWDVSFTAPRRVIPPGEQHTHTFLEMAPFLMASAAICTHWDQFLALLGRGREPARLAIRLKRPPLPARHIIAILGAMVLLNALPHAEELWRCRRAQVKGLTGRDTPECTRELFA